MRDILIHKPEFLLALDETVIPTRKIPLMLTNTGKLQKHPQTVLMKSETLENNKKPL